MKKDPRAGDDRLISGKLRAKAGRAGAKANIIVVDDLALAWTQRHAWFDRSAGLVRAYSISVALRPERTRELVLDVAFKMPDDIRPPSTAQMARALEAGIRAAREAGWDPESRGRAFRFEWEADSAAGT
jgi:hypothetical protein